MAEWSARVVVIVSISSCRSQLTTLSHRQWPETTHMLTAKQPELHQHQFKGAPWGGCMG